MKTNTLKMMAVAATMVSAAGSFAMLSDEEALKAARATLAKMTLEEKVMMTGGSGTMTLAAIYQLLCKERWFRGKNS